MGGTGITLRKLSDEQPYLLVTDEEATNYVMEKLSNIDGVHVLTRDDPNDRIIISLNRKPSDSDTEYIEKLSDICKYQIHLEYYYQ